MEEMLTPKKVAGELDVHYNTVLKLIRKGLLSAVIVGSQYRIRRADLEEYLTNAEKAVKEFIEV